MEGCTYSPYWRISPKAQKYGLHSQWIEQMVEEYQGIDQGKIDEPFQTFHEEWAIFQSRICIRRRNKIRGKWNGINFSWWTVHRKPISFLGLSPDCKKIYHGISIFSNNLTLKCGCREGRHSNENFTGGLIHCCLLKCGLVQGRSTQMRIKRQCKWESKGNTTLDPTVSDSRTRSNSLSFSIITFSNGVISSLWLPIVSNGVAIKGHTLVIASASSSNSAVKGICVTTGGSPTEVGGTERAIFLKIGFFNYPCKSRTVGIT
jgi:hypothetical protein